MKIHLTSRDSHLKGDWWEWMCQKEMNDGRLVEGYVQADGSGNMIAEDTFESNEPPPVKCDDCGLMSDDPRCCINDQDLWK